VNRVVGPGIEGRDAWNAPLPPQSEAEAAAPPAARRTPAWILRSFAARPAPQGRRAVHPRPRRRERRQPRSLALAPLRSRSGRRCDRHWRGRLSRSRWSTVHAPKISREGAHAGS